MGDSNAEWGELAQHDDELAEVWDGFEPLPEPEQNPALDAFVERKNLTINSLVRLGARLAGPQVLAFAGPGWLKFRDVVTDRRWSYTGCDWTRLKIVRAGPEPSDTVLVVEGETDAARVTEAYPCDVAIMPAGAGYFPDSYAAQLVNYELVLVGLDNDTAGERGAQRVIEALPNAVRFAPPASDWCETLSSDLPVLLSPADVEPRIEARVLVELGDLLELEPPPILSWFEGGLLPVAGQLILHGGWKGFKSFLALDLMAALAQGQDWCCFEPTEEPCRVAVMQYEIPWGYYQQRIKLLHDNAREPELLKTHFLTWQPLVRPGFRAGNKVHEDTVLKALESAHVQVFLLDPVRRATGAVDLNSEQDVRPLLGFFERVQDLGITVVTCHHDNKAHVRRGGGDTTGMTGSGAFAGDADTIVSVSLPQGSQIEDPKRNLHFLLRNAPSPGPRGMEMGEDGAIVYAFEPHGFSGEPEEPAI